MNFKKYFFPLICLVVAVLVFIFIQYRKDSKKPEAVHIQQVKIGGQIVDVDLALTAAAQAQGLSGRPDLKENQGMLFVFDHPDAYSFWMKDMNFPIDMIWIGQDLKVTYLKKNALPSSYPELFTPSKNSLYVLEVVSGFADKNNVQEGDEVQFTP